jgi:hypothetical protein
MKQMAKRNNIRLKRFNMKKILLILIALFCIFLISCNINKETKEENPEQENIDNNKNNDNNTINPQNGDNGGSTVDPNEGETENQNNNENGNGETNSQDQNESLSFNEDDFKVDIVITNKDDNKKIKFTKDKYLDFFKKIKDFTYEKYGQCTSCDKILYSISYGENKIDIYEYNFFKINDVLYELTSGSFDFLGEYEYSDSESSGWLPWI